jgi:recombination endonuclease VII
MAIAREPRRRYEYPCEECGEMMTSTRRDKRYCSRPCARKGQIKRREETGDRPGRRELTCSWCGNSFTAPRSDAKYCSTACRSKGYYRENKEMVLARQQAWLAANPEKRQASLARYAERHPGIGKERYARLKADPERLAAEKSRQRKRYEERTDEYLERARRQRERQPTRYLDYKHGCDWAELFARFWHDQEGKCYLCGDPLDPDVYRGIHLDHDHACCPLGRSCELCRRGLACRQCNVLIGWVQDDPDRLRRIADGLEAANALVRERMKESDLTKRGVLFDLEEPA